MNTAIIYTSKHGTTEKVAQKIAAQLSNGTVEIFNLKTDREIDLGKFDTVILGTAIYADTPMQAMKKFCIAQNNTLQAKRLGLFVCGMEPDKEKQQAEITGAFPQNLCEKAISTAFLGGEFLFETMNFFEKMVIRKIAKTDKSVSAIKEERIKEFVGFMS
ncbi:MAG: flavodoxin domain-containing protein [Bacteroidales bacterium]|jgi:menaquinone-dependent protoporphyrinogen oxidase|nr:flavodoxin domain-containing protein [Bacteroidales bacterium]